MRFERHKWVKMMCLQTDPIAEAYSAPQIPSWIWGKDWGEWEQGDRMEWKVKLPSKNSR